MNLVADASVLQNPAAVAGLIARAQDPQRERWLDQVRHTGACRHPIRLRGVITQGEQLVYSTATEPDRALMVRCGNRRAECCPSCAREYQGDMWQLVCAGVAGGRKGVPESVAEHPQVFATLTAPSFGPVHNQPDGGRRCRCGRQHPDDDPSLGAAIDPATYDYEGAVIWNWHAPALWNRFVVELVRALAAGCGLGERQLRELVRVAYVKVAEFQLRGLVHLHAIIRLDGAQDRADAPGLSITAEQLCNAIRRAGRRASFNGDAGNAKTVELRFGKQLDTRVLHDADDGRELTPEQVASYVAKYACKGSHHAITRRGADPDQLRENGVPEQLVQMAIAAIRVSARAGLEGVGKWVHMLGFRGHFVTKSRGYSTTLGALRDDRARWRSDRDEQLVDEDEDEGETVPVLAAWEYIGCGYLNPGDVLLAAGVEAAIRVAREAVLELHRGPPDEAWLTG
jgi:hypothetical protein